MQETEKENTSDSLRVNKGIEQPPVISTQAVKKFLNKRKKLLSAQEYASLIQQADISVLSQAITLIESTLNEHQQLATQIVNLCLPHAGKAKRIGITGVPGVGKSTFIESFGVYLTTLGRKVAVLAIDPSSTKSGGSILGDKTRMEKLSVNPMAYVRPSPSAGTLGGVANKTRETIILCEAAGFDTILIETVGVGQSETMVHSMVDFFLLLMLAGAGDELQGIKRGIMEMADAIAITKSDAGNQDKAMRARAEYAHALHLFPPAESGWIPKVSTCSAITGEGIEALWETIDQYFLLISSNGYMEKLRKDQAKDWLYKNLKEELFNHFFEYSRLNFDLEQIEKQVLNGQQSPTQAARELVEKFITHR